MTDPENVPSRDGAPSYEAPHIERLGTLAELTQGGFPPSIDDGFGAAGDFGSI
jgi:hypothetical protein